MLLQEAIRVVMAQHPDMIDEVFVELFPLEAPPGRHTPEDVFAYRFMNKAGLNIATYIPGLASVMDNGGLVFQRNRNSIGREYHPDSRALKEDISILKNVVVGKFG